MCDKLLGELTFSVSAPAGKIRAILLRDIAKSLRPLMPLPSSWTSTPDRCDASFGNRAFPSAGCAMN